MATRTARLVHVDLLRGLAVFGILVVNVWGFVYGLSHFRYGVADPPVSLADQAAVFLVAAFAEQKFYPIFAFLFGASFALQGRGVPVHSFVATQQRRLRWLLVCGILHGTLLWYGDILTAYALAGFWLLGCAGRPLRDVLASLRTLLVVNLLIAAALLWLTLGVDMPAPALAAQLADLRVEHASYATGSWTAAATARLHDYGANLAGLVIFLPRIMLLFLLGVLAVRLGPLVRPARHRRFWRVVGLAALVVALPINLWWGMTSVQNMLHPAAPPRGYEVAGWLIDLAGPLLGAGYVAAAVLARGRVARAATCALAPVGRMALTHYLTQSLLLMLLLQGFALGLGAQLPRAGLIALCAAIMLGQLAWSHWWLARHPGGPVEALWRRYARALATAGPAA
ncbi:MAG: DUF418 domain-containing protein [Gammaproteobacteria bacterium]